MAFNNVTFGDVPVRSLGLHLASKEIGLPSIQTKTVQIPFMNGELDLTDVLSGRPHYGNREIKMNFNSINLHKLEKLSEVANKFHGKKEKIFFDDDPAWYYYGRLNLNSFKDRRLGAEYQVNADCMPFKYYITSSAEDWLWDPFDFEDGIINEFKDIVNSGTQTYTLISDEQPDFITVTSNAQVTITFSGISVVCPAGKTVLYEFQIEPGENKITISGNATLSLDYRLAKI